MSQVGNIGNEFIGGVTSGLKLQALMTELKRAKLENAEFAANRGHRDLMNSLAEQKGQSDLQLQSINASLLQQELANMPDTATAQGMNKSKLAQSEAGVEQTRAQTGLIGANIKETQARAGLIDAQASEQYARVASQFGQAQGAASSVSGTPFTAEDAANLADVMAGQAKVDPSQIVKFKAFVAPQILSSAQGMMEQKDMLKRQNLDASLLKKQDTISRLAEMAIRTQDPVATLDQLGQHFAAPDEVAAAKAIVSQGLVSKAQQQQDSKPDYLSGAEERLLKNPFDKVQAEKTVLQDLMDKKSNGVKTVGGGIFKSGTPIDKAIEQSQARVNILQNEYDRLRESFTSKPKGKTTVPLKSSVDNPGPKTPADWVAEVKADPKFKGKSAQEIAAEARKRAGVK